MENEMITQEPGAAMLPEVKKIGPEQVKKFLTVLQDYKAGKSQTEARIIASENWWKLRNAQEIQQEEGKPTTGFQSVSGWLHNVIVSKHADAVEAYPEFNILPREATDRPEATKLSAIIPCILEQNRYEDTYSKAAWQKLKTGTGVKKVVWDKNKLNGLGDISITRVNLLNIYWEPGIEDIQKSPYFFHTELYDKEMLYQQHPELRNRLKESTFTSAKFLYDDTVSTKDKVTVIEVYYHRHDGGKTTLQYCRFVEDVVLYATENIPDMAQRGLYDHGKYPYVFDPLFPIEGSPCGYGFVDICRNPQTAIDILNTAFVKNARVGAIPRYFSRQDGNINEEEFLDMEKGIVHVDGNVDEATLRKIEHNALDGNYIAVRDGIIEELRQTSGNTETATGSTVSGVTAASAIAALQEASGKGSRDSSMASWRADAEVVELCIELMRQFYDQPRHFRITGKYGAEDFTTYTNKGLKAVPQGAVAGMDMGMRLPVFDIKISAQKKNAYTKVSQNELALQFFKLGFFNPKMVDQALMCLEIMDFDGKDEIMQKVAKNGTLYQKLVQYMQLALALAKVARPDMVMGLSQDIMQTMGQEGAMNGTTGIQMMRGDPMSGLPQQEHGVVRNAREKSQNASQPNG